MDKKTQENIARIPYIESKIQSIENKIDKILSILEEPIDTLPKKKVSQKKKTTTKKIIQKGDCTLSVYKDAILIGGNTFDRRDLIKGFGARWNPEHKGWTVSSNRLDYVRQELEKYFENVTYIDNKKNKNLISNTNNGASDDNLSFSSGGGCDIDSDSD
tara:strand:+ start:708 stop:1184 length:477 start_codon:yes stop_codon:yes gene_type:complete